MELTDREEAIAQRAAEIAIERVYTEIGKSVVKKVVWMIGAGAVGLYMWMHAKGVL